MRIAALLAQATAQAPVLDVETHRAPIDDVIADLYEAWQGQTANGPSEPLTPEPETA